MSLNDELRSGGRIDEPLDERSVFGGAAEGTSESKIRSLGGIEPVLLPPPTAGAAEATAHADEALWTA